jgi:energy-coupling factor transport system ATP-binding protein
MTDFIDKLNKNGFHIDHAINSMDDLIKEIGGELHE